MDKTFNELFEEFSNSNKKRKNKLDDTAKENAKKLIEMLNFKDVDKLDEQTEKEIDASLGNPDKIEHFTKEGLYFEKRIWYRPNGDIVKILATNEPPVILADKVPVTQPNLKDQLTSALEIEDFETAARLRDEIKEQNKSK
jgi:hypothetical protein